MIQRPNRGLISLPCDSSVASEFLYMYRAFSGGRDCLGHCKELTQSFPMIQFFALVVIEIPSAVMISDIFMTC